MAHYLEKPLVIVLTCNQISSGNILQTNCSVISKFPLLNFRRFDKFQRLDFNVRCSDEIVENLEKPIHFIFVWFFSMQLSFPRFDNSNKLFTSPTSLFSYSVKNKGVKWSTLITTYLIRISKVEIKLGTVRNLTTFIFIAKNFLTQSIFQMWIYLCICKFSLGWTEIEFPFLSSFSFTWHAQMIGQKKGEVNSNSCLPFHQLYE